MTNSDFQRALKHQHAQRESAPGFDETWHAAEIRYRRARRRYKALAGLAATVAAVAIVLKVLVPGPTELPLIEMGELLGSTSWQAPSDVLLPDHQFDLYQDLPALLESTEVATGAFL